MPGAPDVVTPRILLSTDLDRTLIPNGQAQESPGAREWFATLTSRPEVTLVYVTGRHRELVEEAMAQYGLPRPRIVVGDVGSSIHEVTGAGWRAWEEWQTELSHDWPDPTRHELLRLLEGDPHLVLQDASRQARFKLSALAPAREGPWLDALRSRLETFRVQAVHSYDEEGNTGMLDLLPWRGGKLGALEFVRERLEIPRGQTFFAGDSGNDLQVLTSGIPSVLVANATAEVKHEALSQAEARGHSNTLYVARGEGLGMNGNYAAGILEGLIHHFPETRSWIIP